MNECCHFCPPGLFGAAASGLLWGPYAAGKDHPAMHILTHSRQRCKVNLQSFTSGFFAALHSTRAWMHDVWISFASVCCHSNRPLSDISQSQQCSLALTHVTEMSFLLRLLWKGLSDTLTTCFFQWRTSVLQDSCRRCGFCDGLTQAFSHHSFLTVIHPSASNTYDLKI